MILLAIVLFVINAPKESISIVVLGVLVAGGWIWVIYPGLERFQEMEDHVRIGLFNPGLRDSTVRKALDEFETRQIDVQFLMEVSPSTIDAIRSSEFEFKSESFKARADRFGIAVLSREPVARKQVLDLPGTRFPVLEVTLEASSGGHTFLVVHPPPPVSPGMFEMRNQFYSALRERITGDESPDFVVGDLNTSPTSPYFQTLVRPSSWNWFEQPLSMTWPVGKQWLGVRIDHVLYRDGKGIQNYRVGPDLGSDHYPIYATVGTVVNH